MRVFVTGATGFIGTRLVRELLDAGHSVLGLARNEAGVEKLRAAGAEVHPGTLEDLNCLRSGARQADAVVNLAFNHEDMSKFAESAENEVKAVEALGTALEPGKLLLVTSGVALLPGEPGHVRLESDIPVATAEVPRKAELAANTLAERGIGVGVLRMAQIHDTQKQGLVTYLVETARQKGVSAYVGEGENRWAAAHVDDVARLYRAALERTGVHNAVYHAVGEEGVALRSIAEAIATRLNIPTRSLSREEADQHFGPFAHFVAMDMPASSEWTQQTLGWKPTGRGLVDDLLELE